jgi:hypothetical protein
MTDHQVPRRVMEAARRAIKGHDQLRLPLAEQPAGLKDLFSGLVNRLESFRRWLRAWLRKHRVQLALTLRMTVAAVAGLGIAQAPLCRCRCGPCSRP